VDTRDLIIEGLGVDLANAEAQLVAYRALVQHALTEWHRLCDERDTIQRQLQALKGELRRYTANHTQPSKM
jgi:hypothetical protein